MVIFDVSMSLDGLMTAANVRPDEPMGEGGWQLAAFQNSRAQFMGRPELAQALTEELRQLL